MIHKSNLLVLHTSKRLLTCTKTERTTVEDLLRLGICPALPPPCRLKLRCSQGEKMWKDRRGVCGQVCLPLFLLAKIRHSLLDDLNCDDDVQSWQMFPALLSSHVIAEQNLASYVPVSMFAIGVLTSSPGACWKQWKMVSDSTLAWTNGNAREPAPGLPRPFEAKRFEFKRFLFSHVFPSCTSTTYCLKHCAILC